MKKFATSLLFALLCYTSTFAQGSRGANGEISAIVQQNPPQIRLEWTPAVNATGYTLYRKTKDAGSWGPAYASLSVTDSFFVDTAVAPGDAWEYRLTQSGFPTYGNDYIYAGLETPARDYRGKAILVIDTTYQAGLQGEFARFEEDLWGDGWQVLPLLTDRNDHVDSIKNRIRDFYTADPVNVKAVILLGHVPVPYSGNIAPDGHTPDHLGAWPADVYYGELDGVWSDFSVNNTGASRPENDNIPGDGKFDQSSIPSAPELSVGRIDLANMPAFGQGEEELLRHYLDKDHAWRHKEFSSAEKGIVDENFNAQTYGYFGSNGFRNFGPLVGSANSSEADYRSSLNAEDVMWSYGCGGGTYQSAGGVGSTTNFTTDSLRGVFTMLFGSYHGDWDSNNNFMRAALANKGTILNCAWAGRPHWFFHHMGLGEHIGHAMAVSLNYFNLYSPTSFARQVHIALMGDPTLRMHIVSPPSGLTASPVNGDRDVSLTWTASADPNLLGYHVYRQDTLGGRFWRINTTLVTDTSYTDACRPAGDHRYLVRAVELRVCRSGSYYNLSQGIFDTVATAPSFVLDNAALTDTLYCDHDSLWITADMGTPFCDGNSFRFELAIINVDFDNQGVLLGTVQGTLRDSVPGQLPLNFAPGIYPVRIVSTHPPVISDTILVEIRPAPVAAFLVQTFGDSIQCVNTSSYAASYLWTFGDGDSSTAVSPGHVYGVSGNYTVTLIAENECGQHLSTFPLTVVGTEEEKPTAMGIRVWPNPSSGQLSVQLTGTTRSPDQVIMRDLRGTLIREWMGSGNDLETSGIADGIYLLEVRVDDRSWWERVILQH